MYPACYLCLDFDGTRLFKAKTELPRLSSSERRFLATRLERNIRFAELGSLVHLEALLAITDQENRDLPHELRLKALRLFCSGFEPEERLTELLPARQEAYIMFCIEGVIVYSCLEYILNDDDDNVKAEIGSLIAQNWPETFRWIKFLYEVQVLECTEKRARHIKISLANLFTAVSSYVYHLSDIVSSDEALSVITMLWIENSNKPEPLSQALHASFFVGEWNEGRVELMEKFISQPPRIAKIATTRLRHAVEANKPEYEVCLCLDIMHILILEGSPALGKEFVRYRCIPILLSIADKYASVSDGGPLSGNAVSRCLQSVGCILEGVTRVPWLKAALEEGLLKVLIKSSRMIRSKEDIVYLAVRGFFDSIIPMYLVYSPSGPAILEAVSNCFNDADCSEALATTLYSGNLGSEWIACEELILDRSVTRQLILLKRRLKVISCERSECGVTCLRTTFKKCAGCREAPYCSETCHRLDWKTHKRDCRASREYRSLMAKEGVCRFREWFLYNIACCDIQRHAVGLQKLVSEKLKDIAPNQLGIRVNYTSYTIEFDVVDATKVFEINEPEGVTESTTRIAPRVTWKEDVIDTETSIVLFVHTVSKSGEGLFLQFRAPGNLLEVDAVPRRGGPTRACDELGNPVEASFGEIDDLVQRVRDASKSDFEGLDGSVARFRWNEELIRSVVASHLEVEDVQGLHIGGEAYISEI